MIGAAQQTFKRPASNANTPMMKAKTLAKEAKSLPHQMSDSPSVVSMLRPIGPDLNLANFNCVGVIRFLINEVKGLGVNLF